MQPFPDPSSDPVTAAPSAPTARDTRKKRRPDEQPGAARRAAFTRAAIGLEAEFAVVMDGRQVKPEQLFSSPTAIVREPMMHRTGRSYHLPTGSAVYFDTGVIELATPVVELEPGCAARAGRLLWESILFLRQELDAWQQREMKEVQLAGFSTHYNISFDVPESERGPHRTVEKLAWLLTHVLPAPVMLLGANRRSTGIGVRPRGNRIEITADFTPDAGMMIAAATVIVGITRAVMSWASYELGELDIRGIPTFAHLRPETHSSRQGWVARFSSYPENPFTCDIDRPMWETRDGGVLSLRELAGRTTRRFSRSIREISDPLTLRLIGAVMRGRAPSLLELPDRPDSYMDVGRLCRWEDLFPERMLPRSRYERILLHAVSGEPLLMDPDLYTPTGMEGWSHVVFRRERDGTRHVFSLDELMDHLRGWGTGSNRGRRQGPRRTRTSRTSRRRG
ncbi:MAG TPA: hypothetical protein VEA99_10505 [Gemmatimonadaceae bacterium]|nr:hypothetical protein [Gemmatimonadaceae bacterium]